MKFNEWKDQKYFVKIDKNGLLRFERIDGQIWCPIDGELDECKKR